MSDSDNGSSVKSFGDVLFDDEESYYDSDSLTDEDSDEDLPGDDDLSADDSVVDDESDNGVDFSANNAFEVSECDPIRVPCTVLGYTSLSQIVSCDIAENRVDGFLVPHDAVDLIIAGSEMIIS